MSGNKEPYPLFKKTVGRAKSVPSVHSSDDEDEIVFLAEYGQLKDLEKPKKSNDGADADTTFTYTQENDDTLDFNTDDENSSDARLFDKSTVDSVTFFGDRQPNTTNIIHDTDDEDEDEDIKLIFDSKELLDKIDGKLKSICGDFPKENNLLDSKKSKRRKGSSPIVLKVAEEIEDGFTPIETRPSTSREALNEVSCAIDDFVFNQDHSGSRSIDFSSDEDDLLLVLAEQREERKRQVTTPTIHDQQDKKSDNIGIETTEIVENNPDPFVEEINDTSPKSVEQISPSIPLEDNNSSYHIDYTNDEDISKIPELYSKFSKGQETTINDNDTSEPIENLKPALPNENTEKPSTEIPNLSFNKTISSSKQSLNRLKRLHQVEETEDSEQEDLSSTHSKEIVRAKKKQILYSSDEDIEKEPHLSVEPISKEKSTEYSAYSKHLSDKITTKPPPVTAESLFSPKSICVSKLPPVKNSLPENTLAKSTGQKTITGEHVNNKRVTQIIEAPASVKRSKSTSVPAALVLPKSDKKSPPSAQDDLSMSNSKRIKLTSPDRFSIGCKKTLFNAEKEAPVQAQVSVKKTSALNPIDIEKRQLLKKMGSRTAYSYEKPKSKAMEDLKKLKCRENEAAGIKHKKKTLQSSDMNLTQITNLAKRENEARIKAAAEAKKLMESAEANKHGKVSQAAIEKYKESQKHNHPNKQNEEPRVNAYIQKKVPEEKYVNPYIMRKAPENTHVNPYIMKHDVRSEVPNRQLLASLNLKKNAEEPCQTTKGNDILGNIMQQQVKQQKYMAIVNAKNKKNAKEMPLKEKKYDLNLFLFRLLKWPYNWLIEQAKFGKGATPPPLVSDSELTVIVDSYISYEDYFNTMFSLLLLETWAEISRTFKENLREKSKVPRTSTKSLWFKKIEVLSNDLCTLTCQTICEAYGKFPQEEELYRINMNLSVRNEKVEQLDFFGIIKSAYKLKQNDERILKSVSENLNTLNNESRIQTYTESSPSKPSHDARHNQKYNVHEIVFTVRNRKYTAEPGTCLDNEIITSLASSLRRVKALIHIRNSSILNLLLNPSCTNVIYTGTKEYNVDPKLIPIDCNEAQRKVVIDASSIVENPDPRFVFVQGPPGTGKTRTIINIIKMIFNRVDKQIQTDIKMNHELKKNPAMSKTDQEKLNNKRGSSKNAKILICSPSNSNCDEITRRIKELKSRPLLRPNNTKTDCSILRLCSREANAREFDDFNLEILYKKHLNELINRKQCDKSSSLKEHYSNLKMKESALKKKIKILKNSNESETNLRNLKDLEEDLIELVKKKRDFEKKLSSKNPISAADHKRLELEAKEFVVRNADIIICTLNYSGNSILDCMTPEKNKGSTVFTAVIVDEAAQCLEVDFLIPLRFGCNRVIQVGDPEQLPATVLSVKAQDLLLCQSFFERAYQKFRFEETNPIRMLYIQYRMNPEICQFPSMNFYRDKLKTDKKIAEQRLKESTLEPYVIFDITDSKEIADEHGDSIYNPTEATCLLKFSRYIVKNFNYTIGIITPYKKQCSHLKDLLRQNNELGSVEVGTVDSFQGREKDVIFFSSVRANSENQIGFLSNRQRLNVSLTRARYALFIYCNRETLKLNKDWKNCLNDAQNRKLIRKISSKDDPKEILKIKK